MSKETQDGFTPKRDPLDVAIDRLVKAARRFEFWKGHGRRGDGNLDTAKAEMKAARVALKKVIREAGR